MEIKVLKNDDGRVRFDSLEKGACFRSNANEYYIKNNFHGGASRSTLLKSGTISGYFEPGSMVLPVKAKVVIQGGENISGTMEDQDNMPLPAAIKRLLCENRQLRGIVSSMVLLIPEDEFNKFQLRKMRNDVVVDALFTQTPV